MGQSAEISNALIFTVVVLAWLVKAETVGVASIERNDLSGFDTPILRFFGFLPFYLPVCLPLRIFLRSLSINSNRFGTTATLRNL